MHIKTPSEIEELMEEAFVFDMLVQDIPNDFAGKSLREIANISAVRQEHTTNANRKWSMAQQLCEILQVDFVAAKEQFIRDRVNYPEPKPE